MSYVVRCGPKNGHQKDVFKDIGVQTYKLNIFMLLAVIGEIFEQNRLRSSCLQVGPVTC